MLYNFQLLLIASMSVHEHRKSMYIERDMESVHMHEDNGMI